MTSVRLILVFWVSVIGVHWKSCTLQAVAHESSINHGIDIGLRSRKNCLCDLQGEIEDCSCSVDIVDQFNNVKLYPRLKSLLSKDYFRIYKVNLHENCPFWEERGECAMPTCHVQTCRRDDIPLGLRDDATHRLIALVQKKPEETCSKESDVDPELSHLNKTISPDAYKEFESWEVYDEENFAHLPDEDDSAEYVDLLSNPERYTGYKGKSAHRIWKAIYYENCFCINAKMSELCLEKRVFYRIISGLHASINVHLSANYLFTQRTLLLDQATSEREMWGPNAAEFSRRFSTTYTNGDGPKRLKNLYFLYLVELRAIAKVAPYLWNQSFFTGNSLEDDDTKMAVRDILKVVNSFKNHFNESTLFEGGYQDKELKTEFRHRFRNVSRIMDCVGCEKCKLWGKLQVQGLGTALKILFSGKFDSFSDENYDYMRRSSNKDLDGKHSPKLARSEIVSLFNAMGRLSNSIHAIEQLKRMI